jgi:hypothetical protein
MVITIKKFIAAGFSLIECESYMVGCLERDRLFLIKIFYFNFI